MLKKLLLIGKSASGKDTLRSRLLKAGLKPSISHTTRPPREYEKDGVDYHFKTIEEFEKLESENFFIESEIFKVTGGDLWKYGRSYQSVDEADIFISTPTGASNMLKKTYRGRFHIVELVCDDKVRLERSMKRGDDETEVFRRMKTDDEDFNRQRDFSVDEYLDTTDDEAVENFIEKYRK